MPKPKPICSTCGTEKRYSRKYGWFCPSCLLASFLSHKAQLDAAKRYRQSEKGKTAERKYELSEKGKAARQRYLKSEKYKERRREYNKRLQESLAIARKAGLRRPSDLAPDITADQYD